MILNSEEEKSLGSLLADKGIINVVSLGYCFTFTQLDYNLNPKMQKIQ